MKAKSKKTITVYFEDILGTTYTDVQGVSVEDAGVLAFTDYNGGRHFVSPSIRWHVVEEITDIVEKP